jgi:hypothetical protein
MPLGPDEPKAGEPDLSMPTEWIMDVEGGLMIPIVDPDTTDRHAAEVLHLRNVANLTGKCPGCGATIARPNRQQRRAASRARMPLRVQMRHADDCPAGDARVPQVNAKALRIVAGGAA